MTIARSFRRSALLRTVVLSLVVSLIPVIAVESAEAQAGRTFGRNKVVYKNFDFRILKTEHFDIYYYDETAEAAEMVGRLAERWYARLSRVLNHEMRQRQPVILYADHSDFEQTNTSAQFIEEGTQGFTEILKRRLVMPLMVSLHETDHLLGHELVHAFQFDMTGQGQGGPGLDVPGAIRLPLWFIEGMAEYLSIGPVDPFTTMWIRDGLDLEDGFPSIPELRDRRYFPYRYGHAFWSFIAGTYGDDKIGRILTLAARTGNPLAALQAVLETSIDDLSERWRNELETHFASVRADTRQPDEYGRRVVYEPDGEDGFLNLGPSLSPDGSRLIYVSERDLFAVEMYLADAATGRINKRLTRNAVDAHFESLQFIHSSGDWHPDGDRIAVAGIKTGDPLLTILDAESGRILDELRIEGEVGEIYTPSWSPDGAFIAFTGMRRGFTDLYVVNVATREVRRLTDDRYADLQPAWSPDGGRIAFTTDRFTTDFELLVPGTYDVAVFDVATGQVERMPGFRDQFRNFNPQWSPDGEDLFFISDHDGIANLYRIDMASRELFLVTNLWTGVSGLTGISPAASMSRRSGELAFSVNKGGPFSYEIYIIDDPEVLEGVPAPQMLTQVDASVVPPQERLSTGHYELLNNPRLGLADPITFEPEDYRSTLEMDLVTPLSLAFTASEFGSYFAGGASLFFSDLLGDRTLQTLLQVNTLYGDVSRATTAVVGYEDLSSRWNRSVLAGQIPYMTRSFSYGLTEMDGRLANVWREFRFYEISRQVSGAVSYPFNRQSRLELRATANWVYFGARLEDVVTDAATGLLLDVRRQDLDPCQDGTVEYGCSWPSLYLGGIGAALVWDSSVFGGTSPIMGGRARLELTPSFGSLNFLTASADYRRYFRFAPFTLAVRGMHYGRWAGDSGDLRLGRLYLGYPTLVRGYGGNSWDTQACQNAGTSSAQCPYQELLGNRMLVGNVELRLPLIGGIGVIHAPSVPPISVGAFYDTGKAWTGAGDASCSADDGACEFSDRRWVASAGLFTRVNLFGFLIAQIDFVAPLDRAENTMWQFSLSPGF